LVLLSPTAFKGTLTPFSAARIMASALRRKIPNISLTLLPLADGGDGTLDVLLGALKGKKISTIVRGPLGKKVKADWGIVPRRRLAVIEMARASGLALVRGKNRIRGASSFGTGQLIKAALDKGCKTILIGVGGTATADGGAGALEALGLRYLDDQDHILSGRPVDLIRLSRIDRRGLDVRLRRTNIVVLCDVTNPLLGKQGSARTFAPQKGASPHDVEFLERLMKKWSRFANPWTKNRAGTGAAGALAFGLAAFARAKLVRGTPYVMKTLNWKKAARRASVIVTGEGRLDKTSFSGKVIGEILKNRFRAKVCIVCGTNTLSSKEWKRRGITRVEQMGKKGLKSPEPALKAATTRLMELS
jgi:glycerate kinase